MSFNNLGLPKSLITLLENEKFSEAYPIQKEAIPLILKGKDLLGIAKTGSGKTASFVLPILAQLNGLEKDKSRAIDVLVLTPTRELAEQVKNVFIQFTPGLSTPIKTTAVYGGVSINPQMKALFGTNILVATPGRLLDLLDQKALQLNEVQTLVLDEADKMLNLGFHDEMKRIFDLLPQKRQNLLFSATLSEKLDGINRVLLKDPVTVSIEVKENEVDLIDQVAYSVTEERKGPLLRYLIRKNKMSQILVFVSSGKKADNVAVKLNKNRVKATSIHGKKTQQERNNALHLFKQGKVRVLVATDLLARGIDIELLPYVFNYDLPRSPKDYVHRIGRTGRAESNGQAISLITPEEEHHFKIIQKKMKKKVARKESDEIELKGY